VACFFLLFCVSCEKRSIREEQESEQALIRVEGDMLVFKDLPTFSHAVKSITRYSANEYKMWLDNYPNFKSYKLNYNAALDAFDSITSQKDFELFKEKYKQIVKITPDTSIREIFASPVISYFVNMRGRFMIGNSLNILTDNEWIAIDNPNESKIRTALTQKTTDSLKGIFVADYNKNKLLLDEQNETLSNADLSSFHLDDSNYPYVNLPVFYNRTKTVGTRRLTVQFILDHYPQNVDPGNPSTYPVPSTLYNLTLMVNAEYKNLFGWHRNKTGHRVYIPGYSIGYWYGIPYDSPQYITSSLIWEANAEGPFFLPMFSGYSKISLHLLTAADSKVYTDWVTIAKDPANE